MDGRSSLQALLDRWRSREGALPLREVVRELGAIELSRGDLDDVLAFDDRHYRRVLIAGNAFHQVLVLCWRSGQRSVIHDHTGSCCVVKVVHGRATETRFGKSPCGLFHPTGHSVREAGDVIACEGACVHQMANLEPEGSDLVTLHVYTPPLSGWRAYPLSETSLHDNDRIAAYSNATVDRPLLPRREAPASASAKAAGQGPPAEAAEAGPTVAIVGGGFSGTMVAVHLSRAAARRAPRVLLFERQPRFARGLAYGTRCQDHLLNVPADLMSALPDEPGHFLDWLTRRDGAAGPSTFAPRATYGDYLEGLLTEAKESGRVETIRDEVIDVDVADEAGGPVRLRTESGRSFACDRAVLALGNPPPGDLSGTTRPEDLAGYAANPWAPDALKDLDDRGTIVLIGTGLTAIDHIVEALSRGHLGRIIAISRHGLLPQSHNLSGHRPHFTIGAEPRTARSLLRTVRSQAEGQRSAGGDWRAVVDGVRPMAQELWTSLAERERKRFVRHLAPHWDVHRHRVAPQIDERIRRAMADGQVEVVAGRVVAMEQPNGGGIRLTVRGRGQDGTQTLDADRVVNCTGTSRDIRTTDNRLLRALLDRGLSRPDSLNLGLMAGPGGALITEGGREEPRLLAIGPLLKGQLWETTAVRELRCQAQDLARPLLSK